MRPLQLVAKAIMKVVPDGFEHKKDLNRDVESVISSANYSAPETMYVWWGKLAMTLEYYLGEATEGWRLTVLEIMQDKRDYKQYV